MHESQFIRNVNKYLPERIFAWKVNDKFQAGVPDCFYRNKKSTSGVPLWVEYKLVKTLPKRATTKIVPNLSANQILWLKMALAAQESAWVIVGCEGQGVVMTVSEWESGITQGEFMARKMPYRALAKMIDDKLSS